MQSITKLLYIVSRASFERIIANKDPATTLHVIINMAQYGDQLYNIKDKIDVLLNVRVEQDKRDAYAALAKLAAVVNKSLGLFIDASIDWEFTTHPSFTSRSLDDQTKVVRALHQTHLPRIMSSNDGQVGSCYFRIP